MGYNWRYYRRHLMYYREWEINLAQAFVKEYNIKSMIDFGCGIGSYLEGAYLSGVKDLFGIEYNYELARPFIVEEVLANIIREDICHPNLFKTVIKRPYDVSWSVEVAEHIDPNGSEAFAKNLVDSSSRIIALTAAPPGQAGTNHINLRPKEYWIEMIEGMGASYSHEETQKVIKMWNPFLHSKFRYITKNIMIFFK